MNILLIEDNRDLATNMFDYFEASSHTRDLAGDGISGLHFASSKQYDALVLGLMLPGMDGLTLCRRLRDAGRHIPIQMLTALDSLDDKIAGLEAGSVSLTWCPSNWGQAKGISLHGVHKLQVSSRS